jgi:hypothetical protein
MAAHSGAIAGFVASSADGIHYSGSHDNDQGGIAYHWEWVLEGSLKDP